MITAKFRECRSIFSEAPFVGGWVKGRGAVEQSRRALIVPHTHGSSPTRIPPVASLPGLISSAVQPRDFRLDSSARKLATGDSETVRDLFREAQIARLAGYCYDDVDTLRKSVAAEGLQVVASGDTFFTRWYCCKGCITGQVPGDDTVGLVSTDISPDAEDTLHVFFRGVMWRNPEVETVKVWQKLSQSWGVPVTAPDNQNTTLDADSEVRSCLVAHSGILDMAKELYADMRPHLQHHSGYSRQTLGAGPIRMAGHSLGGTLALLVASQFILAGDIDPMRFRLHAFGSPPALSHTSCSADSSSNCGAAVRQRLGLPAASIRNWVLDFDPVPRATTAANPYLQVARRNEVFRSMYDLAGMAATAFGVAHPAQRFFFRHVGNVFMLTHSDPAADSGIKKLPEATADEELAQAPVVGREEGFKPRAIAREILRSVLDHTHTSYGHDLLVAAKLALQQYGVDGAIGGSAVRSGPPRSTVQHHRSGSSHDVDFNSPAHTSFSSTGGSESEALTQWALRRSLAPRPYSHPHAAGGSASNGSLATGHRAVDEDSTVGPQVVAAGSQRGAAGLLALAGRRIAGVRIKNGVEWQPDGSGQVAMQSVSKHNLFTLQHQDCPPLKVASDATRTENNAQPSEEMMNDVSPLRVSPAESNVHAPPAKA